jgi:hypothetical protein
MARTAKKVGQNLKTKEKPSELVASVYSDYIHGVQILHSAFDFFDGKSPIEYWNDGRRRFNSIFKKFDLGPNEWKSDYFSQLTRNKILGGTAHQISKNISASIVAQNKDQMEDEDASMFLKDTVEYTQDKEDFFVKYFWAVVTAQAEGTIILTDEYGTFGDSKEKKAYTNIVPNDEFLPYDPSIRDVQEQERVLWARRMTHGRASWIFGNEPGWSKVIPGNSSSWTYDMQAFVNYDSFADLKDNEVMVISRWKKDGSLDIVVNGVQITKDGNKNPRKDGKYPFVIGMGEPIDANCIWGKSMSDKLAKEHDAIDNLFRSSIDRQELRNKPPVATNRPELVNEDIVIPGNVIYMGEGEKVVTQTLMGLETGTDPATGNLINTLTNNANDSSLNPQQMGASGVGTDTATESSIMAQNAEIMKGLLSTMLGFMIRDWTKLRCQTILWQLSHDLDLRKITMNDRILQSGKIGKRIYLLERGLSLRSPEEKAAMEEMMFKVNKQSNGKKEVVAIDPDVVTNLELFVRIDAEPKPRRTDAFMKAMAAEDWQFYSARPDVFNVSAAAIDFVQSRGGDPDKLVLQKQGGEQPNPAVAGALPEGQTGPGTPDGQPSISGQMTGSLKKVMAASPTL